ncbi:MAG: tRNA pseudouridine(55) synthase TruB [Actinomycetota bacterium]|nr:tRNA pseudouridine(55) synthase TruB [Actinomycetota bacterium]
MNQTKQANSEVNGFVIVDKPAGMTSHDVVHQIRKIAKTKKVGHAGTLDPDATGVLVVGLGKATRLLTFIVADNKTYQATIRLGQSRTTDDAQGEIIETKSCQELNENLIKSEIEKFVGDIEQIPSSVSAIKVDGKRAYDLVRQGENVILLPRLIHISAIDVHEINKVEDFIDVSVTVHCSSGTYIRALARDLGNNLNVGGHLTGLRRTQSGQWSITNAQKLVDLKSSNMTVISMAQVAISIFPSVTIGNDETQDFINGRSVRVTHTPAETIAVVDKKPSLVALAHGDGVMLKPHTVFATGNSGV